MGRTEVKVQWLIVTVLWIYISYRAVVIGITQDEAYSYYLVKSNNWRAMPGTLNTHWLNTLAIKLFLWFPGADHVWKLRALPVLSWWLYSFSAIKLSAVFKNKILGFVFFLACVLNPFLILYFSLARGYALSCAFLLFSLWQAYRVLRLQELSPGNWIKVFLPASIAVLANFSSFYFFISVAVIYFFLLLVSKKVSLLFKTSASGLICLILGTSIFAIFSLLFIRFHSREFEGSETSDFIYSLFGSQIKAGSYLHLDSSIFYLGLILFIVLVIFIIVSGYRYFVSKMMSIWAFSVFVSMTVALANILLHVLFKTPFIYGRTGLMFYTSLLPGLFGTVDEWPQKRETSGFGLKILSVLAGLLLIVNFYKGINLDYFSEWPFQADTRKSLDYLQRLKARQVGLTLWHFSVFQHYYSRAYPDKYNFSTVMINDGAISDTQTFNCDHLIVTISDSSKKALKNNWIVNWSNLPTRTLILSRK